MEESPCEALHCALGAASLAIAGASGPYEEGQRTVQAELVRENNGIDLIICQPSSVLESEVA